MEASPHRVRPDELEFDRLTSSICALSEVGRPVRLAERRCVQLDLMILEFPEGVKGCRWRLKGDSKRVVDWINGKARERMARGATGSIQRQLREWWSEKADIAHFP